MRANQIDDMDVVADISSVPRRVVGAENLDRGMLAERRIESTLIEMRRARPKLQSPRDDSSVAGQGCYSVTYRTSNCDTQD